MWTNNRLQDNRGMNHSYPRQPLATPNTPWQNTGGILPDGRQMLPGWRPPTAMANGMPPAHLVPSSEQKQLDTDQVGSNNQETQKLTNDVNDKNISTSGVAVSVPKETGIKYVLWQCGLHYLLCIKIQ